MMRITNVQPGCGQKLHIHVDGAYSFSTDTFFWATCGLGVADTLTPDQLAALQQAAACARAKDRGMRLLAQRPYAKQELCRRLCERGGDPEAAAAAVEKLEALGLLCDADFARQLAQHLVTQKKYGTSRVLRELLARGVARELAEQAVAALTIDDEQQIRTLLETRFRGQLSDEKGCRRAVDALLRRGYDYGSVRSALRSMRAEQED